MKINFKNWLAITEARFEDQAFASTDDPSREYGRQQNPIVAKIVEAKRGWKVELTPHKGFADTVLKIDGYFKSGELAGKSVQISARTAKNAGPDIAYKLTSKPMQINEIVDVPFTEIMAMNPGKAAANVDYHLLKTADDDHIYLALDSDLKKAMNDLISNVKPFFTRNDLREKAKGRYGASFRYGKNEIRLVPSDRGHGLIAYINIIDHAIDDIPMTKEDEYKAIQEIENEKKEELKKAAQEKQFFAGMPEGITQRQFTILNQMKQKDPMYPYLCMKLPNKADKLKAFMKWLNRQPELGYKEDNVLGAKYLKIFNKQQPEPTGKCDDKSKQ